VNFPRGNRRGRWPPSLGAVAAAWLGLLMGIVPAAEAEAPLDLRPTPLAAPRLPSQVPSTRPGFAPTIGDVALRPDGVFEGRVICPEDDSAEAAVAGLPVSLFRGSRRVAAATTDAHGRFALRSLSGGLYRVVVHTPGEPTGRLYRLWTRAAAPPHADRVAVIPIGDGTVRGQSPFGLWRYPRAVAVGVIAAGAIATPIIYSSAKRDHFIPASP
jgi:hypothetical protein